MKIWWNKVSFFISRGAFTELILNFGLRGSIRFGERFTFWGEHSWDSQQALDPQNLRHYVLKWAKLLADSLREQLWEIVYQSNDILIGVANSNSKWNFRKMRHFRQKRSQAYLKITYPQWNFWELIDLKFD